MIITGGVEKPARSLPPVVEGQNPPPEVTLALDVYPASVTDGVDAHPSRRQMVLATGVVGEVFRYQLWIASKRPMSLTYAIIAFLDYHQVTINGQEVMVVHLKGSHQEAIIDAELKLPADAGMHELQFVWVWDPYRSILKKEVTSPFVYASPRVGINVIAGDKGR